MKGENQIVERRRKKEEGRVIEEIKERAKWWRRENLRVEKKKRMRK